MSGRRVSCKLDQAFIEEDVSKKRFQHPQGLASLTALLFDRSGKLCDCEGPL